MKKSLLILLSSFLLSFSVFAEDDLTGSPGDSCNCGPDLTNVEQVIQAMAKTDVVVPIDVYYKLAKIGTANFSITHVDGKILKATINGEINAFGFRESETIEIDIERLIQGQGINYYSNMQESPIIDVSPTNVTLEGGSLDLKVKMRDGIRSIPLEISKSGDSFYASTNGRSIRKLKIYLGFDISESIARREIINGRVNSYKIQ